MARYLFNSAKTRNHDILYNGGTPYNASNFQIVLTNGSTYTKASTILDVIKEMVPDSFGYSEQNWNPSAAVYDSVQDRSEMSANITLTASGGAIQFDRSVLIADRTFSDSNGIRKRGSRAVLTIDAAANKLHFTLATAIDLPADTPVVVTADAGGTVPSELLSGGNPQILYVRNPVDTGGERSIQLALTAGGSPIDFSAGAGTIRVRYAGGSLVWYDTYGVQSINDTQTGSLSIPSNYSDGNADVNAA